MVTLAGAPMPAQAAISPTGYWYYTAPGQDLLVEISESGGTYEMKSLEATHVAGSSCPLPAGTLFETFTETGSDFTGEAGLWNTATCAFIEWATLEVKWEGETLVTTIGGVCSAGCAPTLTKAVPRVVTKSAAAGETNATLNGEVNPALQTTGYYAAYDLASSAWCKGSQGSVPAHVTASKNLPSVDKTGHPVAVELSGLLPASQYCGTIVAANASGTAQGQAVSFRNVCGSHSTSTSGDDLLGTA